jgi:hypothetical protein
MASGTTSYTGSYLKIKDNLGPTGRRRERYDFIDDEYADPTMLTARHARRRHHRR